MTTLVVVAASLLASPPAQAAPGDLDPTFSGDGRQITDFGGGDGAQGVVVQGDGKIVAAGVSEGDFALARYGADGSIDASFAGDGKLTTDFGPGGSVAFDVAVQANGKIVAVGGGLARYNADGSLDTSFGGDGVVTAGSGYALAIQPDGKIVAAGASGGDFALVRYNSDGSLDTTFGGDGEQTVDFGGEYDAAFDVVIQADGKIVAAGSGGLEFGLVRYSADGSLDGSFSGDGKQTTAVGPDWDSSGDSASGVAVQADGKIVAAGTAGLEFGVARYSADGSLDGSFSDDGKQTTSFGSLWGETGSGVGLHSDGRIVVVGACCWTDLGPAFGLARFNGDGSPDVTFSDDGRQGTVFDPPGSSASAMDIAIQPDGNIVVAGGTSFEGGSGSDFALARYERGSAASGTAPTNSSPPTISGSATDGQTLTVNAGTWTGSTPTQRTYQWRRCDSAGANCTDIASATGTSYPLTAADIGRTIQVRETATNAYGAGSADSAATGVVKANPGVIAGTVLSKSKKAGIPSASVSCGASYSATTATEGSYSIPNVAPGRYSCTASASGYRPSTQTVTVASGKTTTANFNLVRS